MKVISVQNLSRPVEEWRAKSGEVYSIQENTCKDIPEQDALEMVREFPWLELMGHAEGYYEKKNEYKNYAHVLQPPKTELDEFNVKDDEQILPGLPKEDIMYSCPACETQFPSLKGMRLHQARIHKQ